MCYNRTGITESGITTKLDSGISYNNKLESPITELGITWKGIWYIISVEKEIWYKGAFIKYEAEDKMFMSLIAMQASCSRSGLLSASYDSYECPLLFAVCWSELLTKSAGR